MGYNLHSCDSSVRLGCGACSVSHASDFSNLYVALPCGLRNRSRLNQKVLMCSFQLYVYGMATREDKKANIETLVIQAKELILGFIRPENLVCHGLSPLGAFWQTPSWLSCAFH